MTRRDWLLLAGWVILAALVVWQGRQRSADELVALAAATKALERSSALESEVEALTREIERLRTENKNREDYWNTLSREVDRLRLEADR